MTVNKGERKEPMTEKKDSFAAEGEPATCKTVQYSNIRCSLIVF